MGAAALLCVVSLLQAVAGFAPDDSTIRTAVAAWLSDSAAAEAAYGHISTWETGGVTDMDYLFCGAPWVMCNPAARSFNEDIGAWDTSGVTTMDFMFQTYSTPAFNQDLSGWAVHSVTSMNQMFAHQEVFDQDLGWCVDDDVNLRYAFDDTLCESTSCGVHQGICDYPMTDSNIRTAVSAWVSNPTAAEATYGHISTWATGGVTDMSYLFCGSTWWSECNTGASSFNEDIGAWDTSGVTTTYRMFAYASAFNQDIGAWDTSGVTSMDWMFGEASAFNQDLSGWALQSARNMEEMFSGASSFNQDLGWCLDAGTSLDYAFSNTPCERTSCGVKANLMSDSTIRKAVEDWFPSNTHTSNSDAVAKYGHISTWDTSEVTDMRELFCQFRDTCTHRCPVDGCRWRSYTTVSRFNADISAWDTSSVTDMSFMFGGNYRFNQPLQSWSVGKVTDMSYMFRFGSAFDQNLGWCVRPDVDLFWAFSAAPCDPTLCGVVRGTFDANGEVVCLPAKKEKEESSVAVIVGTIAAAAFLLAVGAFCFYRRRKASMIYKADERSSPPKFNPEPTELPPPEEATSSKEATAPEAVETRAAAKAKDAETSERPGFTRKLSSFLFGEQEEEEPTALAVAEAEEAPSAEQPPPPTPAEPTAPKAEEMYNQIAAWYNEPENAALRARWGAYPEPEDFQTWSGFVAVTNVFLDREAG